MFLAVWFLAGAVWLPVAEWPSQEPTANGHDYDADRPLELADGRRVFVEFTEQGLVERHQSAKGEPWSKPRVLHAEPGDTECPVELSAYGDTVAVMAHWDVGCNDPAADTAIAAVGDDGLTDWDVEPIDHIDRWEWTRFSWSGYRVVFRKSGGDGIEELSWRESIGFTGP
ncbi:hypothetical protein [Streptomyces cavernicola]|uniref:Uncharacterized protein n=1 Tax=Streptomyces cavernicola TaxID=3043613 RepID=A0ABT6SE05_9ACTN|nr:hypothetical protein [Streptomyces sp. B-S-A6]MDI3406200.1 hypothetical protein [Streptomyces sp. B-S-A6]